MTISKQFRVTVDVPSIVWEKFGNTPEYEREVLKATRGAIASGCNHRDEATEWAIFTDLTNAQACENRLKDIFRGLSARLASTWRKQTNWRPHATCTR
ncbi:MAG: hypothetical protein KJZ90_00070 [Rhodocyclaceae bacterium]|nr:hypothetical protein [Rhodocyclaceae bacterium]